MQPSNFPTEGGPVPVSPPDRLSRNRTLLVCAVLYLLTLVAFLGVAHNGFINYDDPDYVTRNPHVLTGLTWANLRWAFTSTGAFYWQPLAWLSHMLDVQLFGLNPHWHHLVSLHFHALNALVLFLVLQSMTGATWRSFFVAALFALHPLRVESVAWVAERKDLLSTLFCLLTIWAYAKYVLLLKANPSASSRLPRAWYVLALALYALGLMCKPMLVTLPVALLLLDFWPLGRLHPQEAQNPKPETRTPNSESLDPSLGGGESAAPSIFFFGLRIPALGLPPSGANLPGLLLEKLPFAFLAAISCLVTILATAKTYAMVRGLPFGLRAANAVASYLIYLGQTVWPARLAVFYPHPNTRYFATHDAFLYPVSEQWPAWQILAAVLCLVCVSILAVLRRRTQPWLFTGWFWYLLTLVPVIGLVQVGMQARADRFTYMPLIGIFVAVVWTASEIRNRIGKGRLVPGASIRSPGHQNEERTRRPFAFGFRIFFPVLGLLCLLICVLCTRRQVVFWRDDRTLFAHALAVTSRNPVAEWMVGASFAGQGQLGLAQTHFRRALEADPYLAEAHAALGSLFEVEGRPELATNQYHITLRLQPRNEFARLHLAGLLLKLGQPGLALAQYELAVRSNPDSVEANYQAGALLLDAGQLRRAEAFLETALQLQPNHPDALLCLSDLRTQEGRTADAIDALQRVVRLYPSNFELRVNLGSLLWKAGRPEPALLEYRQALALNPAQPIIHYDLGVALLGQGQLAEAVTELREALRLKPDYPEAEAELRRALAQQGQAKEGSLSIEH